MQTPVFIPAEHVTWELAPPPPGELAGGPYHQYIWRRCTIIGFAGFATTDGDRGTQAIAFFPTNELFQDRVEAFRVLPEVDLTPPEIEVPTVEDGIESVKAAQRVVDAGKKRRRE